MEELLNNLDSCIIYDKDKDCILDRTKAMIIINNWLRVNAQDYIDECESRI